MADPAERSIPPTLVIHAREDPLVQGGAYVADHIPRAVARTRGTDDAPWFTDPDRIIPRSRSSHRQRCRTVAVTSALRTVLFTDMVPSTQHVAANGDERWRGVDAGEIISDLMERFAARGEEHRRRLLHHVRRPDAGDPPRRDLARRCRDTGHRDRVGIATGQGDLLDTDIGGIAVRIAARIHGEAGGEILVSRTVRGLVVGWVRASRMGSVELRGVPGTWQLLAVDLDGARAGSAEANLRQRRPPAPRPGCAERTAPWR